MMKLAKAFALLCMIGAVPAFAIAAEPVASSTSLKIDRARVDAALEKMVADGRAAGVSALVWKDGREVYFGVAGHADREAKRPMARNTIVQIFSMTKPVTGVALMQLWEQGKFGLDDPLSRYLPEFRDMQTYAGTNGEGVAQYRPAARLITIRDLMRHSAGFADGGTDTPVHVAYSKANVSALDHDLSELGKRLATVPLLYDPGERWYYSDAVDVQALLVERLSGQPFADYVKFNVLTPLKMNDTGWRLPESAFGRFAASYINANGTLTRVADAQNRTMNFQDNRLTPGGFGLASTLDDYMRFARMLLNKGELEGARLLKPSTVRLMATDQLDPRITERRWLPDKGAVGFGLDFAVRHSQPQGAEEKRGAVGEFFWDGWLSTLFFVDPANNLAAVFLVQTQPFDGTMHHDFREALYGPNYLGPKGD
jgi:CubicO group peptidase (beta-lactamase class C family)